MNGTRQPISPFRVAIDGPAGAGKSTLAESLAQELSLTHVNTGILYRGLSYVLLRRQSDREPRSIKELLDADDVETYKEVQAYAPEFTDNKVYINKENITPYLRTPEIDSIVGVVAKYPNVRHRIGEIQRSLIDKYADTGVVVEGRDIGTVIMPEAELKVFLVASIGIRAKRRAEEAHGESIATIAEEIKKRDALDVSRVVSPLIQAPDSIVIDNTCLSVADTVNIIKRIIDKRWNK
ncbi:CMP/dCMP kinase [Nematocida sp. AWRm77]|nr:CMP/dCMP kinase [Nematocida sp. AWRm77]